MIIKVNTDYQLGSVHQVLQVGHDRGRHPDRHDPHQDHHHHSGPGEVKNYTAVRSTPASAARYRNYAYDGTYTIRRYRGLPSCSRRRAGQPSMPPIAGRRQPARGRRRSAVRPLRSEELQPPLKYALVLHIHDAGFMGDDPMIALTESQGPVNFASTTVQKIAKIRVLAASSSFARRSPTHFAPRVMTTP